MSSITPYFDYLKMYDFALPPDRSNVETLKGWLTKKGVLHHTRTRNTFNRFPMAELSMTTCMIYYRKSGYSSRVFNRAKRLASPGKGEFMPDQPAINMALFDEARASFVHLPSHVLITGRDFKLPVWLENRVHVMHTADPRITCNRVNSIAAPGLFSNALGNIVTFSLDENAYPIHPWQGISVDVAGDNFRSKINGARFIKNFTKC